MTYHALQSDVKVRHDDAQKCDVDAHGPTRDVTQPILAFRHPQLLHNEVVEASQEPLEELSIVQDEVAVSSQNEEVADILSGWWCGLGSGRCGTGRVQFAC